MMGPQWLCDCNASGEAEDLHSANVNAARHFLKHDSGESSISVGVYKERGDWSHSITTLDQAQKAAYPMMQVSPLLKGLAEDAQAAQVYFEAFTNAMEGRAPHTHTFTLPRDQITFREAQAAVSNMYTEAVWNTRNINWGRSRGLTSGI